MGTLSRIRAVFSDADTGDVHLYECKSCGAHFALRRQVCPKCGGYTLDRIDWSP
jgi:uncharacterized OB-fold protein